MRLVPELTVSQQLLQATIARPSELSRLTVLYDGRELKSAINATQLAIWNAGNKPILPTDVLDSILLSFDAPIEILGASIRKTTREIVTPNVTIVGADRNVVNFRFKVLEPGDGAVVQVIYAGDTGARIRASGNVIGQSKIRVTSVASTKAYDSEPETRWSRWLKTMLVALIVGLLTLVSGFAAYSMARYGYLSRSQTRSKRIEHLVQFATFTVFFILGTLGLIGLLVISSGPPFPF